MRLNQLLRLTASAAVLMGLSAGAVQAQDEPDRVDDIIVTAQKREQSLQDVPIVVTTLSQGCFRTRASVTSRISRS